MNCTPPPLRARSTADLVASYTASTSLPSTVTAEIPYPFAFSARSCTANCVLDAAREAIRRARPRREGEGGRDLRGDGGRQRRARRVRGHQVGGRARPEGRGGTVHRGEDLPPQGPRRARRPALRAAGRARLVGEAERPGRSLREAAASA